MGGASKKVAPAFWLALPVWVFLALALVYPLARIVALGVGKGFGEALANPYYWGRLLWSLEYGLGSSFLVVVLALPLSYAFRFQFPGREVLLSFALAPFVMPAIVVAMGFMALVGPRGITGINLYGTPWVLFWASVFYNLGMTLRILVPVLAGLEASLSAARTLGASATRAYLRVGLPLLAPALLAGASLTFLYSFASFGVPLLLGGPGYSTLEVEIYTLLAQRLQFAQASALVIVQLIVTGLVVSVYLRTQTVLAHSLGAERPPRPLARPVAWGLAGFVAILFALLFSPLLALLWRSLEHPGAFASVFSSQDFTPAGAALANSLRFALLALLLDLPLGFFYAYAVWRGGRVLDLVGLLPLLISPVAVGLGYLVAYPGLRGSLWILIGAYALQSYPLLGRALLPGLRALPRGVLEAARVLGASPWRRLVRVEWPLVKTSILAGVALALAAVIGEFGATLVLQRPEWTTLSLAIYERLGRPGLGPFSEALALSAMLALVTVLLYTALDRAHQRPG